MKESKTDGASDLLKTCSDLMENTNKQAKHLGEMKNALVLQIEGLYKNLKPEEKQKNEGVLKEMNYLLNNADKLEMGEVLRRIEKIKQHGGNFS